MPVCNMILQWPPSVGDIYFPFLFNLAWPCNLLWSTECYSRDSVWVPGIDIKSLIPLFPLWSLCSLLAWAGAGGAEWVADRAWQRQILSWAVSLQCPWKPTTELWLAQVRLSPATEVPPAYRIMSKVNGGCFQSLSFWQCLLCRKSWLIQTSQRGLKF